MNIEIAHQITHILVKGEIHMLRPNPWVRPFLYCIQTHPKASEEEICREMFCDNGNARKAAVRNILFFFKQQGIIESSKEAGFVLTKAGTNSLKTGDIWQGLKGVFQLTMWTPKAYHLPYILDVQPVPEHWYDNGRQGLEEFPEEFGENLCNLPLGTNDFKLDTIGMQGRPTYVETEIKADMTRNGKTTISGTFKNQGMKPFEVSFTVDDEVADEHLN